MDGGGGGAECGGLESKVADWSAVDFWETPFVSLSLPNATWREMQRPLLVSG